MIGKAPATLTKLTINWDDVRRVEQFVSDNDVTVVITWRNDATTAYDLGPETLNFYDHLMDNWGLWKKGGLAALNFGHAERTS